SRSDTPSSPNKGLAISGQALVSRIGGAKGSRTPDLYNAIVALSQLSYGPTPEFRCRIARSRPVDANLETRVGGFTRKSWLASALQRSSPSSTFSITSATSSSSSPSSEASSSTSSSSSPTSSTGRSTSAISVSTGVGFFATGAGLPRRDGLLASGS